MDVEQHPANLGEPPRQQQTRNAATAAQVERLKDSVSRLTLEPLPQGLGEDAGVDNMGLDGTWAQKAQGPGFRQDPQDLLVGHRVTTA